MDAALFGSEALPYGAVSVTSSTTLILDRQHSQQRNANLYNNGSVLIYIGSDANLTTANGYPLGAGNAITLNTRSPIYGITASSTCDVRWLVEAA